MLMTTLKDRLLAARRARLTAEIAPLTTLIGEAEAVGKNAGNRATTDEEVVAVIRKFIKGVEQSLEVAPPDRVDALNAELGLYAEFLPRQYSEKALRQVITDLIMDRVIAHGQQKPKLGTIMADLKAAHGGRYDGALAARLIKEALA